MQEKFSEGNLCDFWKIPEYMLALYTEFGLILLTLILNICSIPEWA